MTPRPTLMKELNSKNKEITEDIANLDKKVCTSLSHLTSWPYIDSASVPGKVPGEAVQ